MLSERGLSFLANRRISEETAFRFGLYTVHRPDGDAPPTADDAAEWLAIPYMSGREIVSVRFRNMDPNCDSDKRYRSRKGDKPRLFNRDVLADDPGLASQPLIITEGELDAIAATEAGNKYQRVVAIPGAKCASVVEDELSEFGEVNKVILATDADEAGELLQEELITILGQPRCATLVYPLRHKGATERCKDLGEVLQRYGASGVAQTIEAAKYIPITGYYNIGNLPPRPKLEVVKLRSLGDDFYRHIGICRRQISVWTGEPNDGKTTLLKAVLWALNRERDWTAAAAFFEDDADSQTKPDMLALFAGRELGPGPEEDAAMEDLERVFHVIEADENATTTVDYWLTRAEAAVRRDGADIVVLDPFSELDLTLAGSRASETELIRQTVMELRRFAKRFNVHVAIVAHPRKFEEYGGTKKMAHGNDVAGSLHFRARCDLGITVQRDADIDYMTNVWVWKSRRQKEMGPTGKFSLLFHPSSGRFTPLDSRAVAEMRGEDPKVVDFKKRAAGADA